MAALAELDGIWIAAAARVGIPVVRGGDAYVHFDGRALHLADDAALDGDDSLAQLVLHELCHSLVEGPARRHTPDWGLDNTTDADAVREAAAVRLQAHLAGAYGLRRQLPPTTVVRAFYDALPTDALAPADDESTRIAKVAAWRAAQSPWREALHEALAATARALVPGDERHPRTSWPLLEPAATDAPSAASLDGKSATEEAARSRCGDCAWRSAGGLCRVAAAAGTRRFVDEDASACARFEAALDCTACGACCRSAYGAVLVPPGAALARRHPSLVVLDGTTRLIARAPVADARGRDAEDRCAALAGPLGGPFACRVYDDRPAPCRDLAAGGRHCLTARRRVGLSV